MLSLINNNYAKQLANIVVDYAWNSIKAQLNSTIIGYSWAVGIKVFFTLLVECGFFAVKTVITCVFKTLKKWIFTIFFIKPKYEKIRKTLFEPSIAKHVEIETKSEDTIPQKSFLILI